jgi:hypothetical protein
VNRISGHPKDFCPYLDRDSSDPKYEEIRRHLDVCVPCRAPVGILARLQPLFQPWKLAWNVTLATILLGAVIFSGIEYRKNFEEKQLLLAITRYTQEEGQRIAADGNPFQTAAAEHDNPFARSPFAGKGRPSAERR